MTELTLSKAETACMRRHCETAPVILEYGSGGSTQLFASLPGKLVLSVESDRDWAIKLQAEIDAGRPASPVVIWHVDIGPTGRWGQPLNDSAWWRFHLYPMSIWDQSFFRHPDLILINGHFRAACFAAACLRITRPTTVLFNDYLQREDYYRVERLLQPDGLVGRMAIFNLVPNSVPREMMTEVLGLFADETYATSSAGHTVEDPRLYVAHGSGQG